MKAAFLVLAALLALTATEAASSRKLLAQDIVVTWDFATIAGYANGVYPIIYANVGDTLVVKWNSAPRPHTLYQISSHACPSNFSAPGNTLLSPAGGPSTLGQVTLNLNTPGNIYLACGVGAHCSADGMLLEIVVGSGVAAAAPTPAVSRQALAPNTAPFGAGAPIRPAAPAPAPATAG